MGLFSEFKERCYAFVHVDVHPESFPIDAWSDPAYQTWFENNRASAAELDGQRGARLAYEPFFSLIVPLYKTPLDYLHVMVGSVLAQTYGNFELVLVNASPENEELAAEVEKYRMHDDRVKTVLLPDNLGITENTNYGIAEASGDFLCFLDHDDYLEPDLLYEYAKALNNDPDIDVLYCDEDLVSFEKGRFVHLHPLFKPSYSPELLLCKNYIIHLMTIRRHIVDKMPTPNAQYDGAQDYNMVLYATSHAKKVHCVQKILYHWRISKNSTAANPDAKPYSRRAYRLSAQNQLDRKWPRARIVSSGIVNIHNLWFAAEHSVKISIIVDCVSQAALDHFVEMFNQTNSYRNFEIIAVSTAHLHATKLLASQSFFSVLSDANSSVFSRFNKGAEHASGEYLLFVDGGCFFLTPEPLEQLLSLCEGEGVGAVAPKSLFCDGSTMCYGIAVTSKRIMPLYRGYPDDFPGYQCNLRAFQNFSAVAYRGMLTPKKQFSQVGGFNELFEGEIGTADYCKRLARTGCRVVQTPTVKIQSSERSEESRYENDSNAPDFTEADTALFDRLWPGERAKGDPYVNRNLDQSSCYMQIAKFSRTGSVKQS
ncbi:hypothetical protein C1878_15845 [Gordonibacter sp. 28C]|uniref:glycosyltransferase n=1 Tax=Gordonibacter sp. 28C TaxID=2078569 RepID=UPI000DF78AD7|nr:glycosyltransferase [Gordonibacter sp. 28C]RDB58965.1 hypothetical protein C1878_15845 [Gordonibacter sp. 28C]